MNYAYDFKFLEYIYNNGYLGDFYFFFLKYMSLFIFPCMYENWTLGVVSVRNLYSVTVPLEKGMATHSSTLA